MQFLPEAFCCGSTGLGSDIYFVPHTLKGSAHFLFTVGIVSGSIIKGHACRIGFVKQSNGCFLGDPLDGQRSEGVLLYGDPGAAQSLPDFSSVPYNYNSSSC